MRTRFLASPSALLQTYDAALRVRPRLVKAMTGGSLAFLGDLNAQHLELWSRNQQQRINGSSSEPESFQFDHWRSLAFSTMAFGWSGPANHAFYNLLERFMPQAGGGVRTVAAKVVASQLLVNPFLYLPTFYLWTGGVLGRSLKETGDKAQREYWSMLKATWAVLGTANVLAFSVVPVPYQATFMAVASFAYQNVLSLLANRRPHNVMEASE